MGRRPWFPFYIDDWEGAETVKLSDNRVRGAYLRLLCHQWRKGSLPPGVGELAAIAGEPERAFRVMWKRLEGKFPINGDGRRSNIRMAGEIAKADRLSAVRSANAKQRQS